MNSFLCILVLLPLSCLGTSKAPFLSDAFIKSINDQQATWTAGRNFPEDTPREHLKRLASRVPYAGNANITVKLYAPLADIPETFDAREQWSQCSSIKNIRDQEQCGSCWAFSAVEVITDRLCIASNGGVVFKFSPEDLLDCCGYCGSCDGGNEASGMEYWVKSGIVSGGDYGSNEGCQPYSQSSINGNTPACSTTCLNTNYPTSYNDDKHYGDSLHQVANNVEQIQTEILKNGPVTAAYEVYEDFYNYQSGVYIHTSGEDVGGHAIKILGWGTENGTPYWLVANSWGAYWGDAGFFKILRGQNHCGIEEYVFAPTPKV